ncbi:MAG: APC family permease, partial [Solirubrobacterales bacterium]|nr:APC family permease [Solirubrobacterales bacterium]
MSTSAPAQVPGTNLKSEGLDRGVGFWGLMFTSEGSLIGSGWLLGALTAAALAGPSAIFGWVLGSVIVFLLALVHAELAGMFPVAGGTSRFAHYSFGSFAGITFGWASYLQAAAVAPIEVLATLQYTSGSVGFAHSWVTTHTVNGSTTHTLSGVGILVALALLVFFAALNTVGIRLLAKVNGAITTWKIAIPVVTILIFLIGYFHSANLGSSVGGFFAHKGGALQNILLTLPGGIVFSFLGFEQAIQLGGEAQDPKQLIRAVFVALGLATVIFILVQLAFLGSVPTNLLHTAGGWTSDCLNGVGKCGGNQTLVEMTSSPFKTVASIVGLSWLATILSIDAVVSPAGTGLVYETSTSRLSFGMAKNGFLPSAFETVSSGTKAPIVGIVVAAVVGILFLLPFPSWSALVNVITSTAVLMYAGAPLALMALRKQKPNAPRPYRVPAAEVLAPLSFVAATWVIQFSGWYTVTTLMLGMLIGYALVALTYALKLNAKAPAMDWASAPWIVTYLFGMLVLSFIYPYNKKGAFGGLTNIWAGHADGSIALWLSLLLDAVFALAIYFWAIRTRLPVEKVNEYETDVHVE